jgi:two-component sensor histidine kinase
MRMLAEDKDHLVDQLNVLVEGQDRLLDQKRILAEELQHRVRNNLQLVYGMLSRQLEETTDVLGQRGLRAIARRVSTLARVYDHLLGTEMSRTTDFGGYMKSLCLSLAEIQAVADGAIKLTCESDVITLDLDMVTALGIVVTELVTNSFDHAFSSGDGAISVSARREGPDDANAILTISDNGNGFVPQAESKRHGLGLVRRLVEQVRGTISVKFDHGTTWTITFPTEADADPIAPPIAA